MTGISKGAGMIRPNMATMLGYLAIDAKVAQPVLDELVKHAADHSFNCITIDGDTSTNDSFILIATGTGSLAMAAELKTAVTNIARSLRSRSSATAKAPPSSGPSPSPSPSTSAPAWRSAARLRTRLRTRRW